MPRKDSQLSWGKLKPICLDPAGTPVNHFNLLKKIFLSETNSRTSKIKALGPVCQFRAFRPLAQNESTLSLEDALAFMFCAFMSFSAARETFTSISFVVMLLTEPSVNESDSNRKDQIYPLCTATYDAPWSFLFTLIPLSEYIY